MLDEWQKTFTIDDKKKDGRALIKLLKHISEETGRSYDAVLRRYWMDIEFTKDLELLRDWDNIKWTEDATQEEIDYFTFAFANDLESRQSYLRKKNPDLKEEEIQQIVDQVDQDTPEAPTGTILDQIRQGS